MVTDLASILAAVVLLCSIIGLFGRWHWLADLFNHHRPQAVITGAFIFIIAGWQHNQPLLVGALSIIVLNLAYMVGCLGRFAAQPRMQTTRAVSLLMANVLSTNRQHARLVAAVRQHKPAIVVLAEPTDAWLQGVAALESLYPHRALHPQNVTNFGLAVYSTLPFTAQLLKLGLFQTPCVKADFGDFYLYAVHPIAPRTRLFNVAATTYNAEVLAYIATADKPVVITGDFNCSLWAHGMAPFALAGFASATRSPVITWPAWGRAFGMHIDHVLSRGVRTDTFKVLPPIGSDHLPITATIRL